MGFVRSIPWFVERSYSIYSRMAGILCHGLTVPLVLRILSFLTRYLQSSQQTVESCCCVVVNGANDQTTFWCVNVGHPDVRKRVLGPKRSHNSLSQGTGNSGTWIHIDALATQSTVTVQSCGAAVLEVLPGSYRHAR